MNTTTTPTEALLRIDQLSIRFGDKAVVDQLSLELHAGQTLAIVGESGSGKSLTALSLLGLLPRGAQQDAQSLTLHLSPTKQYDLRSFSSPQDWQSVRGRAIGMIFQEPMSALNPLLRCGEQIEETLRMHLGLSAAQAKAQCLEWLHNVKLQDPERVQQAYPHELSGGQKQRVMIAMAMCGHPVLLLADEPTTALDATVQLEIIHLMRELQQQYGTAILFISHDLSLVADFADNVVVMRQGKVVEQGTRQAIFDHPQADYTRALLNCRPPLHRKVDRLYSIEAGLALQPAPQRGVGAAVVPPSERDFSETLLRVEGLSTWFPVRQSWFGRTKTWVKAVEDATFALKTGQTLGLVGESGSGKTTLGRSILRLIEPRSGEVFYRDQSVLQLDDAALRALRREVQIVFQDPYSALNPRIPIGMAIAEPMKVHGIGHSNRDRLDRVVALLEQVGLEADQVNRLPAEFSGGQRQRICIARALAMEPRFIVCDEAVSSLDVSVQATVLNLLKDLQRQYGLTYLFISHDLAVVRYMSDEVMVMKDGKIVEKGSVAQVFDAPSHSYTQALLKAAY